MADDNTITVEFDADTSNAEAGIKQVNDALGGMQRATKAAAAPADQLFKALERSSDRAVAGLIRGTQSWHKAFLNIIQDMEVKFAQLEVNALLTWARGEAQKLLLSQTSDATEVASNAAKNTAIVTSDEAAADSGSIATGEQLVKQIGSDAAATYAGVFAFLAPIMGPAAAAPAGASMGAVASMEGLVSLDVGAWNVPQNMPAFLHAGEMVVPQNFAAGLRDGGAMGAGGGDSYTINVNAIDTQTGAQFLKNNASVIAQTMSSQARNFNRNVPGWKS